MPPRPIHRWKTLWLGLLALAFLGWAWIDSTRNQTQLHYRQTQLVHAGSGLCLTYAGPLPGPGAGLPRTVPAEWTRAPIDAFDSIWKTARLEAPAHFRGRGLISPVFAARGEQPLHLLLGRTAAEHHFRRLARRDTPGSLGLYLPHWLLITALLLPWTALLAWRHHRIKTINTNSEPRTSNSEY